MNRRRAAVVLLTALLATGGALLVLEYGWWPTLSVRLETSDPETIEIFWDTGSEFNETERFTFKQPAAGSAEVRLPLPVGVRAIRIDPKTGRGPVRILGIRIRRLFELSEWTLENAFQGWVPGHDVANIAIKDGVLELDSSGTDPHIVNEHVGAQLARPLNIERLVVGGLAGILSAFIAWLGLRRPARQIPVAAPKPRPAPRAGPPGRRAPRVALAAGSLLVFGAVAYVIVQMFFSSEPNHYRDPTGAYRLSFLDHRGRRLSETDGKLGLMLDPFTFFRNYPNQRTDHFTIDENGFRGGIPDGRKPKIVIVGGSAAFGRGLRSDDETFVAQLNHLVPEYSFINAAVVGFASGQELAHMIHHLDRLQPDTYVAFDGWNDLVDFGRQRKHFGACGDLYFAFAERLHQYHLLLRNPAGRPWPFPAAEDERDDAEHREDVLRIYASNIEKMRAWARARRARFVVVFQPEVRSKQNRTDAEERIPFVASTSNAYRDFVRQAKSFCRANGIPYCDINEEPTFQHSPKTLFLDPVHMSADGHQVVARVLQRVLAGL